MASDLRHWPHDFFTEFIELYQSFPCLWQVKSKDYSNRDKKNQAYAVLVNKCKEVDREATKESVTKKINSFRTVYRKECAKIKSSKRTGTGADDIYKPSLWYFDLLCFLDDEDQQPRKSRTNMEAFEREGEGELESGEMESPVQAVFSAPPTPGEEIMESERDTVSSRDTPPSSDRSLITKKSKRTQSWSNRKNSNDPTIEILQLAGEKLKAIGSDDEYDAYAKYIAHKLRDLKGNQHIFARKLINDVIFEAELGALTKDFKVVNVAGSSGGQFSMQPSFPYYHQANPSNRTMDYQQPSYPQLSHSQDIGHRTSLDTNTNTGNSLSSEEIAVHFMNFGSNA